MHHHNQNCTPSAEHVERQESKLEGVIIAIACLAVFALWGVLLALGV
jgi:hypothetical protein